MSIHCIEGGCPRAVSPTIGGAWCDRHRPLDLTGGAMPWDAVRPRTSRGAIAAVRGGWGATRAALSAAGWVREGTRWRDPILRDAVTHSTARDRLVARTMGEARGRVARGVA